MPQTEIIKQIIYLIYTLIFIGIWYFDYKKSQERYKQKIKANLALRNDILNASDRIITQLRITDVESNRISKISKYNNKFHTTL